MALMLDTNVILFGLMQPDRIPAHIHRMIGDSHQPCVASTVSFYEIGLKSALGKLILPPSFDLARHLRQSDIEILPIMPEHATRAANLPLVHRDPWDRMIVAQCLIDGHQLVSSDTTLGELGIARLW